MRLALALLALLIQTAAICEEKLAPIFAPPPRLAISVEELAAAKAKPDFAALRDAATKAADPFVATPITLPDGFGSWVFYYACTDDGTPLRMLAPAVHECPKCKKHFSDERTLAAYRGIQHSNAEAAALKLAWAYAYSSNNAYAEQVKRILTKFADDYPNYPGRIDRWNRTGFFAPLGGRRRVQSLEEAEGILPLAKAYDLTRTAPVWSDAERQHVEKNFFRLTADTLLRFPMGKENRQAWYNAGLLAIASVLADATLVEKVLRGPSSFDDQLQRGVGDDGMWWEGTMAYQSYVIQPMIETINIARGMDIALQDHPRFKLFLRSPLRATYPNGVFPCINDSDPANIHLFDATFDWAWKTYKDPVFAQAIAWENPARLAAMLGTDAKPQSPLDNKTADLASIGLLFLRVGEGPNAVCVTHHYGTPGGDAGGHGHFDKLNITLFANGREWLADIGRIGYTHKEYKTWAKRTIAHNTVTLNLTDQAVNTGTLLWLKTGSDYAASAAESTGCYPGTKLRRHLFLTESMLVDVFDVKSEYESTIDLAAHAITAPLVPGEARTGEKKDPLGTDNGYQHLTDISAWAPKENSSWIFPDANGPDAKRLRVHFAHAPEERIFTTTGIGYSPEQKAPCLVRRREGKSARFVSVYDLSGSGNVVRKIESREVLSPTVRVWTSAGNYEITFQPDGVQYSKLPE